MDWTPVTDETLPHDYSMVQVAYRQLDGKYAVTCLALEESTFLNIYSYSFWKPLSDPPSDEDSAQEEER